MNADTFKDQLIKYLSNEKIVRMAFLYGSFARGTAIKDSDLDIAVYFEDPASPEEVDRIWDELQKITGKDVELLNLNQAKEPISWQAIRGIPLVIKNWNFYLEYMLNISSEAMDFQEDLEDLWLMKRKFRYA